jgi:S1-C subfamily serine protease
VDGQQVASPSALIALLREREPGSWVAVDVERGADAFEFRLRLGARPRDTRSIRMREGWIGIRAIELPSKLREHFRAPAEAGVMVSWIEPGSPAEAAGFELGDVVYEVDGTPVPNSRRLSSHVIGGGVGNTLEVTLVRDGVEIVLEPTVEEAPRRESREAP